VKIGLLGTLLVHVLLLLLAILVRWNQPADSAEPPPEAPIFEVQLAPATPIPPTPTVVPLPPVVPPKAPPKFVEINPAAPDNVPLQTNNIGAQNQQAAQEKPTPNGKSSTPALNGDPKESSLAIVTGRLNPPTPPRPPPPPPTPPPVEPPAARQAKSGLSGTEKVQGTNPDTTGAGVATSPPNATPVPEPTEGEKYASEHNGYTIGQVVKVDPRKPEDRLAIATSPVKARPSPLLHNDAGADRPGLIAYDAKWDEFAAYLDRFLDTVQEQWYMNIEDGSVYPPPPTWVTVTFKIDSDGKIAAIVKVASNQADPLRAESSCVGAITTRAPYGAWSPAMIAELGKSQELTLRFLWY
jgi:hypothetical protein